MFILNRSRGVSGGVYQSVMITPPNGSAEFSGMNETVSSAARHRNPLTPIPGPPVLSLSLSPPKMPSRLNPPPSPKTDGAGPSLV